MIIKTLDFSAAAGRNFSSARECSTVCMILGACQFLVLNATSGHCDFYTGDLVFGDRTEDGVDVVGSTELNICKMWGTISHHHRA